MPLMRAGQTSRHQRTTALTSASVGFATTAFVVGLLLFGWLTTFEWMTLDLRFKYLSPTPTDPSLVLIAIDDGSVEETIGRWPWSRAKQASMVRTLSECGIRALIVDLNWDTGEPVALDLTPYEDLVTPPSELASATGYLRLSDGELAEALERIGNAYLAFGTDSEDPWDAPELEEQLLAELRGRPLVQQLPNRLQRQFGLAKEYLDDIHRPIDQNANDPNVADGDQRRAARRVALRTQVRATQLDQPTLNPSDLFKQTLARIAPGQSAQSENALTLDLRQAVISVCGIDATKKSAALEVSANTLPAEWSIEQIKPVLPMFASVARRCGFVSFTPDADGIARRLQLIVKHGDQVLPQLGFAYVCDALGAQPELIRSGQDSPIQAIRMGQIDIQVDAQGQALIPWIAGSDWTGQFTPHVPADVLVELGEWQAQLIFLHHRKELQSAELFLIEGMPGREAFENALVSAADAARSGRLLTLSEHLESAAGIRTNNRAALLKAHQDAVDTGDAAKADELGFLIEQLPILDQSLASLDAAIERLTQRYTAGLRRVRPLVADRVCFIGYTASALADMTPIPTHPRAPGVLAHMNLVNGLLTGNTIQWRSLGFNVVVTIMLGLFATLANVNMRPRSAAGITLLLVVGYALICLALFYADIWLQIVPPVLAGITAAIAIQFYRFVFVDRERRQLSTALSQYTSPAIARLVAEDVELCRRAEQRIVSVMFTDLKGFTTISERIGAERTQAILNTCLGRFTDVIQRREGLVNKFLGDGIFAFWNPVIYPQENHAELAIQTAFDLCIALVKLREEYHDDDPAFADLAMRIGVATGEAVVGPCGSEQKYDYTCIGDTVNLAARLESANKYFGTAILINQSLRDAAGGDYLYREIGSVQVKGKHLGVPVFEPLGREGQVPDDRLDHARRFASGVEMFVNRDWQGAGAAFGECILQRPDDLAAMRYAEWCDRYAHNPPDEDWNGALELTEK
jgi:class 3 adenylate cyclase/CHASE2 domain-containing sensor protein